MIDLDKAGEWTPEEQRELAELLRNPPDELFDGLVGPSGYCSIPLKDALRSIINAATGCLM